MIRTLMPYLSFGGQAADAIELYTTAVGAEVVSVMRWGDMPGADLPPEAAERVMHAELKIGGGLLFLADGPPDMEIAGGNNTSVILQCTEPGDVDRMYTALVQGGTALMKPEDTFWNARYAMCVDRYGIRWMFNCPLEQTAS